MNTIIKWPGGKSREVDKIYNLIPKYDRYIEPFFGGGAVYFALEPSKACINDISALLMEFYSMVKKQDEELKKYLMYYNDTFSSLLSTSRKHETELLAVYHQNDDVSSIVDMVIDESKDCDGLVMDKKAYKSIILKMVKDKFKRTHNNDLKQPFSHEDLVENLITGFASGYYMYFRDVYNTLNTGKVEKSRAYTVANFYFLREYCYGSMFRYNSKGEFNIPYGGMSYNKKFFVNKINKIFNSEISDLFENTDIQNEDFEEFFSKIKPTENDLIFLDPPYDTEFSDYEGRAFDKTDQARLANALCKIKSKFILIIKNTDYIYSLYEGKFNILTFDKNYTYNVRSRNERKVEHLIITNIDVDNEQ